MGIRSGGIIMRIGSAGGIGVVRITLAESFAIKSFETGGPELKNSSRRITVGLHH
jgi:hypothetical protein